jgi:hypothetical protein
VVDAFQPHVLLEALTVTLLLPLAAPKEALPDERVKVQGTAVKLAASVRFALAVNV